MRFRETPLAGAYVLELERHADERGFFARTFDERELAEHGISHPFPQCNLSRNTKTGTLRGMHYNAAPHSEAKLVRCATGAIWDAIVDFRAGSPTYKRWFGIELSAQEGNALYVPEGFVHGFITLQDATDVFYQMGKSFQPNAARGLRWNDPALGITWPRTPAVISERDATYPDFDPNRFDG